MPYTLQSLNNILFLDIETVSCTASYDDLNDTYKSLWDKKATYLCKELAEDSATLFAQKAGIFAEFGRIIVIGLGQITTDEQGTLRMYLKALYSHDEKSLLQDFKAKLIDIISKRSSLKLCAHNGKEFDFPYLCRRMTVKGLPLPFILDTSGKKPWEVNHLDTMEMWKFGDRKQYTALETLAALFNIPSSKTSMQGSQVSHYYHTTRDLETIARYCMQDVAVMGQIFVKLNFLPDIASEHIFFNQWPE